MTRVLVFLSIRSQDSISNSQLLLQHAFQVIIRNAVVIWRSVLHVGKIASLNNAGFH